MTNRYANINGTEKIRHSYNQITEGFDGVQADIDAFGLSVKSYDAVGDGVADDTTHISAAVTAAAGKSVIFPAGVYKVSSNLTFPSNVKVIFMPGASLSINAGVTVTFNGPVEAGTTQIFSGTGTVTGLETARPEWWGAVGNGVTGDSTAIGKAFQAAKVVIFRATQYLINAKVSIPQGKTLTLLGTGNKQTELVVAAGITGLEYVRLSGQSGSVVTMRDIVLVESGLGKLSFGITFHGFDTTFHDNWLRMENCFMYGFDRAVNLKYCGQCHFINCYAQSNRTVYFLDRDSSFIYWDRCMSLSNQTTVYADDPLADGISNALFFTNCNSIHCSSLDYRILGWQGVYFYGGGCDLGEGGDAAIYLGTCMDVTIDSMYISSNTAVTTTRDGVWLQSSHTVAITKCSIVNNEIGIHVQGVNGVGTKVVIEGNKFEGNLDNDIFLNTYTTSSKITLNHFMSVLSRTGTNYDIYANTTGTDRNFITLNTFRGATYTIATGVNSVTTNNIFSAAA